MGVESLLLNFQNPVLVLNAANMVIGLGQCQSGARNIHLDRALL